jgi:diketogulonate reductase-like aldo/keto reductase
LEIAEKKGKTTQQVLLMWGLQNGWGVIPSSVHNDCSQRDHKGYTPVDLLQMRRAKPPGLVDLFESLSATPMEHT